MKWQQIAALLIGLVAVGFLLMSILNMQDEARKKPVSEDDESHGILGAAVLATLFLILTILAVFQ
jgi:hypothetical protein